MADMRADLKSEEDTDMIKSLHAQIDELELEIERLQGELAKTKKALYRACADYYSLHMPYGHRDVDTIYNDYMRDVEDNDV